MLKPLALAALLAAPAPGAAPAAAGASPGLPPPCACRCALPLDPPASEAAIEAAYRGVGTVFRGRVVGHNRPLSDDPADARAMVGRDPLSPYLFQVRESFKGPRQRLIGAFNDPQCGLSGLEIGAEVLVYAFRREDGEGWETHWLSMCTRSRAVADVYRAERFGSVEDEVAVLRRLAAAEE